MLQKIHAGVGMLPAQQKGFPVGFEGVDHADHHHKGYGGPHQGRGDVSEHLPLVCPLQPGTLIQLLRDHVQPCQQQNHIVAAVLPHIKSHQHPEGCRAFHPAHRGKAQGLQQRVQRPLLSQEHIHHHHDACHRHHHGKQQHIAEQLCARELLLQCQRQQHAYHQNQRHAQAQKAQGVACCQTEAACAQHIGIIIQPHKGLPAGAKSEGIPERKPKRQSKKHQRAQQNRGGQRIAGQRPAPFPSAVPLHPVFPPLRVSFDKTALSVYHSSVLYISA